MRIQMYRRDDKGRFISVKLQVSGQARELHIFKIWTENCEKANTLLQCIDSNNIEPVVQCSVLQTQNGV